MKTISINLYSFNELNEDTQQKTIDQNMDINLHDHWFHCIYEQAENYGFTITSFDLGRANYCEIENKTSFTEIAENIEHFHKDLYKSSIDFLASYNLLQSKLEDQNEDLEDLEDQIIDLEDQFKKDLENEFLDLLRNEYEYLYSDEAIKETLINLGDCFTADGEIF